jgi:hypothetical protein
MCPDITKYEIYLNAPDARAYRKICLDGNPPCRQEGGRPTFPELTVSVGNARVAGPRFRECNRQGGQQDGRHSERLVNAPPICAGRGLGQRRSVLILPHCLAGARQWVDDRANCFNQRGTARWLQRLRQGQGTRLTTTPKLDPQQPFALTKGATLPVNAGGNSETEQRRREDGPEPQVEASLKRQEADPVRRKCRMATAEQSRLRSRRWPRPAVPGLLGKPCCAPDRSRARRCALRLQVRQGVPAPRRQAAPSVRIEDNLCEVMAKTKPNRGAAWSAVSVGVSCHISRWSNRNDDGFPPLPCR